MTLYPNIKPNIQPPSYEETMQTNSIPSAPFKTTYSASPVQYRIIRAPISGKTRLLLACILSGMILASSLLLAFVGGPLAIALAASLFLGAVPLALIAWGIKVLCEKFCEKKNDRIMHHINGENINIYIYDNSYRYDSWYYNLLTLNFLSNISRPSIHHHHYHSHHSHHTANKGSGIGSILLAIFVIALLMGSTIMLVCAVALSMFFLFKTLKPDHNPESKQKERHLANFLICASITIATPLFCRIAYLKHPRVFYVGTAEFTTQVKRFFSNCTRNFTISQFFAVATSFLMIIGTIVGIIFINNREILHLKNKNEVPIHGDGDIFTPNDPIRNKNEQYNVEMQLSQLFQSEDLQFQILEAYAIENLHTQL